VRARREFTRKLVEELNWLVVREKEMVSGPVFHEGKALNRSQVHVASVRVGRKKRGRRLCEENVDGR
jgi:hypothetical protein